jgi:hypothetical protein
MYMIYVLSRANLLVLLCLLLGLSDCRSKIKVYEDAFFILYFLCLYIQIFVMLSTFFYYVELFVTKLKALTYMKCKVYI